MLFKLCKFADCFTINLVSMDSILLIRERNPFNITKHIVIGKAFTLQESLTIHYTIGSELRCNNDCFTSKSIKQILWNG